MRYKVLSIIIVGISVIVLANAGFFYAYIKFWFFQPQLIETTNKPPVKEEIKYAFNRLFIPSLGIDAPVVFPLKADEKVFQEYLSSGVAHYPGTANAGEEGNAYFFGHSSDYVWKKHPYKNVFALLSEIELGEKIILTDNLGKAYQYTVNEKFVTSPKDLDLLKQDTGDKRIITLQTSYPLGSAAKRFIVRGILP